MNGPEFARTCGLTREKQPAGRGTWDMARESTILLVDDNDDDVLLMKRAIQKAKMQNPITVRRDGMEAIEFLSQFRSSEVVADPPIMVVLDLKMPRMSGFDVLSWIRQQPSLRRMWVVILSHSQEQSDVNRAYDLGANSYLVKPTRLASLIEMIDLISRYWIGLCQKPDCRANE